MRGGGVCEGTYATAHSRLMRLMLVLLPGFVVL